jgi:hypothetical protein
MNDEEIEEAANEQFMDWHLNGQANIQIGMVRIIDNFQPFNLSSPYPFANGKFDHNKRDNIAEWGNNDNIDSTKKDQPLDLAVCHSENHINISESTLIRVPKKWAKFFQAILNSPFSYQWAKNLLQSNLLAVICKSGDFTRINISTKPNDHNSDLCTRLDSLNNYVVSEEVMLCEEEPPVTPKSTKKLRKVKNKTPVVESEVRRSIRVRGQSNGFKPSGCKKANCLGCNIKPPTLSVEALQDIGINLCNLTTEEVDEAILNKKKPNPIVKKKGKNKAKNKEDKEGAEDEAGPSEVQKED